MLRYKSFGKFYCWNIYIIEADGFTTFITYKMYVVIMMMARAAITFT